MRDREPNGRLWKTVSHVVIGLKTSKGTKQLKLDSSIYESLQKEKVQAGDEIYFIIIVSAKPIY